MNAHSRSQVALQCCLGRRCGDSLPSRPTDFRNSEKLYIGWAKSKYCAVQEIDPFPSITHCVTQSLSPWLNFHYAGTEKPLTSSWDAETKDKCILLKTMLDSLFSLTTTCAPLYLYRVQDDMGLLTVLRNTSIFYRGNSLSKPSFCTNWTVGRVYESSAAKPNSHCFGNIAA